MYTGGMADMKELFIREPGNKVTQMCNVITLAVAALFLLVFAGCSPVKTASVDKSKPWASVTMSIDKNSKYPPTIAIWVRDDASGDAATLYVTAKAGKGQLKARPGALPVWSGITAKTANEAVDAVTSATPATADAVLTVQVPDKFKGKKLTFFIEANVSYDYNDFYKEGLKAGDTGYNDVNGQPSVIWTAAADTAANPSGVLTLVPAGHGDVLGATANADTDMTHITTAAFMLSGVKIEYDMK